MGKKVEVCFSPALYNLYDTNNSIVVVVDILRATSVICTMFMNGVKEVIPVRDIDEAKRLKNEGYIVVAERDGKKLDFADFGNSPFFFTEKIVKNKLLVYSTTNGTNAITIGQNSKQIIIGSFLNFQAVVDYLIKQNENVLLLCAGWKDKFNIEDTIYCGAIAEKLLKNNSFDSICDSVQTSIELWKLAENDILGFIEKTAQYNRLKKMGYDNVIPYCHTFNKTNIIPVFKNGKLLKL